MRTDEIKSFLDEKSEKYNHPLFIETDPIQIPKKFSQKNDIEIAAFLTATVAWGNRQSIIKNANHLMSLMAFSPSDFVMNAGSSDLQSLEKFTHRTFKGDDCIYFIKSLQNIYTNHNSLQTIFENGYQQNKSVKGALEHFYSIFFEIEGERTRKHVSNVAKGASGKRLNMLLRWMVRKDKNGVDFGIWNKIPKSALMLPLDVHTGNVARKLGILTRKSNDWRAVEEITKILRKFDAEDPVKYDFALFGLGAFEKF